MKKGILLLGLFPLLLGMSAFASDLDEIVVPEAIVEDALSKADETILNDIELNLESESEVPEEEASASYGDSNSNQLNELIDSVNDINDKLDYMIMGSEIELMSVDEVQDHEMTLTRYEYETYMLLRYLTIATCCCLGALLVLIFSGRSRRGTA